MRRCNVPCSTVIRRVDAYCRAYRVSRGHLAADLDPLGMRDSDTHPELDLARLWLLVQRTWIARSFIDNVLGPADRDHEARSSISVKRHLTAALRAANNCNL